MPRKKKSARGAKRLPAGAKQRPKEVDAPKPTYLKSKNGRYYKKTKLPSGKCQCRFVSKAEAEAGGYGSSEVKKTKKERPKEVESS